MTFKSANTLQTILLSDFDYIQINNKKAAGTITPGMILLKNSSDAYKVHDVAEGSWGGAVACEDELQGNTIDDNYLITNLVRVAVVRRGTRVNLILKNGENVSIGDKLVSAGDGMLKKMGTDSVDIAAPANGIVGEADEALNLSGSTAKNGRLAVRIW